MIPSVRQNERDGALGVVPPGEGAAYAVIGVSEKGAIDTPSTFTEPADLFAAFGRGPAVEALAHAMDRYGRIGLFVRTGAATPGSYLDEVTGEDGTISAITKTGAGTATFANNSSDPLVAGSWKVLFLVGGTQGTGGIVYQVFKDNVSQLVTGLGTASSFTIPGTQISISVSALGTIVAGDFITFTTTAPIPASAGEVTYSGLQNAPSLDGATHPDDDYEVKILFVAGGTRGVDGITYRWSLDDGRTYSAVTALGTATSIVVPESGGVKIDLGSGTIAAGATIAFPCVAPKWNGTELGTALTALRNVDVDWELVHVIGPCNADDASAIDAAIQAMAAVGKLHWFFCSTRMPVGDETEADYRASLAAEFADFATTWGAIGSGAEQTVSAINSRKYVRPTAFITAAREASLRRQENAAWVGHGSLPVTRIRDAGGNPLHHDEAINPGLDDAGFYVLRTIEGYRGVYVNRPLLKSAEGSDFRLVPHRRVMNRSRAISRQVLIRVVLNRELPVDATTGRILERAAREIEAEVLAALEGELLGEPAEASAVSWKLSRTDNLLADPTLNALHEIVPLVYPETIVEQVSFRNPALRVVPT